MISMLLVDEEFVNVLTFFQKVEHIGRVRLYVGCCDVECQMLSCGEIDGEVKFSSKNKECTIEICACHWS